MSHAHENFLLQIRQYVIANPDVAPYVSDYVASGLTEVLARTRQQCADMELALSVSVARRYPNKEEFIIGKLERWSGKTALLWDATLDKLRAKVKQ